MFGDINRVELMGNLTADPEIRYTANGTAVCTVGLATNRRYNQNDEWKDDTTFHNLVLWSKKAEQLVERAKKGTRIYVEGRLQTRSWDGEDGKKNYRTEIIVTRFIFIDRYEKGPSDNTSKPAENAQESSASDQVPEVEVISDEDLPF